MIDQALPILQDAVDALHARLSSGRERATGAAVVTGMTGPAETVSPEALDVLGHVMGGRFRDQMTAICSRDDVAAQGLSEQDWALECEAASHAIRRGHDDEGLVRIVEEVVRAVAYRAKHDERRGQTTWLAQDVANAVATVKKRRADKSGPILDLDEDTTPTPPPNETCEQKAIRLERELAQERAAHARTRAEKAVQATIICNQRATIERHNREKYAERRLRRSKLKSAQVDTFMTIARLGTQRAQWHDRDAPIITGENIADENGWNESTARLNAEAVCNLPGSPIERVSDYRKDGTYGKLTTYKLASRDPIELMERMVVVAESLKDRKSTRPRPIRCPKHPRAKVDILTQHQCSRCGVVLKSDFPTAEPLYGELPRIEAEPPAVAGSVVTNGEVPRIGQPDSDELAERRARAAVAIPSRAPDRWKQPAPPAPAHCRLCPSLELYQLDDGRWRCDGCGEVAS